LPTRTNGEDRVPESYPTTPIFDELRREFRDAPPDADRRVDVDADADTASGATQSADEP
jgi:hypothetical protein